MNILMFAGGVVALLTILWAANMLLQRPRRFADENVDGAPDAAPAEIAKAKEHDAWNNPQNALDPDKD